MIWTRWQPTPRTCTDCGRGGLIGHAEYTFQAGALKCWDCYLANDWSLKVWPAETMTPEVNADMDGVTFWQDSNRRR